MKIYSKVIHVTAPFDSEEMFHKNVIKSISEIQNEKLQAEVQYSSSGGYSALILGYKNE